MAICLFSLGHYGSMWGLQVRALGAPEEEGRRTGRMSSWPLAHILANSFLMPQVFSPSQWLPQPAFQETLRPIPAHDNQPPALAQGLGGRRAGGHNENVVVSRQSASLLQGSFCCWRGSGTLPCSTHGDLGSSMGSLPLASSGPSMCHICVD